MDRFSYVWFDLNGRITRRTWLVFTLLLAILAYLAEVLIRAAFHLPNPPPAPGGPFLMAYLGDEGALLAELIFLWPSLAIDIKRWHDIGKSGWNTLILYAPASVLVLLEAMAVGGTLATPDKWVAAMLYMFGIIALVYLIVLAARKGMPAENRFGPAPN